MTRFVLLITLAGCGGSSNVDGSVPELEMGMSEFSVTGDGGLPLSAAFTMTGCARLDQPSGMLRCTGAAPLTVTFVPIGEGVATVRWSFACGDMGTCRQLTPTVTFDQPNTHAITLSVAGINGSTATATGEIDVTPGSTGAVCDEPVDCDLNGGLSCLCAGGGCPGALALGLCTRSCASKGCAVGEVCADLSRGAPAAPPDGGDGDGGVTSDEWRAALCLPSCVQTSDCTRGFVCRDLPSPAAGGWRRGCFADLLGDVGDSCAAPDGTPDPGNCLSGRCDPLGARGVCSAACSSSMPCPTGASCLQFNGAAASQCLARCDATHPCPSNDPLLACSGPRAGASFGFVAPAGDPPGTTYCVPKACSGPSDCAPAGTCTMGFCTR